MDILINIVVALVFFVLGYRFCLRRNSVMQMFELAKLLSALIGKEITPQEAIKKMDEIEKTI